MTKPIAAILSLVAVCLLSPLTVLAQPERPKAGPVETLPVGEVRPGIQGVAWTVFSGMEPESVPVEIIGLWKNATGPGQDVILAKLGGKAQETNVAGGMSGSPVYIDGKLIGAIALRLSTFSPDAICGITPIELMLDVSEFDDSVPAEARTPDRALVQVGPQIPEDLPQAVAAGAAPNAFGHQPLMVPIEAPLTFTGFHPGVLEQFGPLFNRLGFNAVQGGAAASLYDPTPAPGWENALQPGEAVTAVVVSGDMSVTGHGTVTYNDGKRILAFGHSLFNLGPLEMPMSRAEVLTTLASEYQPNKVGNATEIVGAVRQDRHSGIMGVLGEQAPTVPVHLKVRTFDNRDQVRREREFRFNVFVHEKWTPYLMTLTLFNSISELNDFADEATYRFSGEVELDGQPNISLTTMRAAGGALAPAPMSLATWWGSKFNRLFLSPGEIPKLTRVNATIDLLPRRRTATIEAAWAALSDVEPGSDVPVKVFLRAYRGEGIQKDITVRIPAGLPAGQHRILLSGADVLNRMQQAAAAMDRDMELPQAVSLINQERSNSRLYVSLVEARPTLLLSDKALPSLPASVANVIDAGRAGSRQVLAMGESAQEQTSIPFDLVVEGSYSLQINVQ